MKILAAALALAVSAPALAQVRVEVAVPTIRFAAPPPLVQVEPGVQVVGDYGEEVFFTDGYYWHRRDGRWFRSRDHQGHWAVVEDRIVPRHIVAYTPGRYRNWHPAAVKEQHEIRHEQREINHEQREINHERREEHK